MFVLYGLIFVLLASTRNKNRRISVVLRRRFTKLFSPEGIEASSHLGESFIPWLAIREITSHGFGIFQDLRIWLKEPVGHTKFVVIPLRFIDRHALKKSILQTHPENPLHEAAVRYL